MSPMAKRLLRVISFALAFTLERSSAQVISSNPYRLYGPTFNSGYWGYSGDPYGGYLHGAADVIHSQATFLISRQESELLKQQVRSAKLKTRREEIQQWLWERANLPTTEDERERLQQSQLRRSLNDPPLTEIWSGKSFNDLLAEAQKKPPYNSALGRAPVDQALLEKINVTSGKAGGNIGLIKEGKIAWWPLLLRRKAFDSERVQFERRVAEAIKQARLGQIDAELLEGMISESTRLEARLASAAKSAGDRATWTPTMYIDAKNFLVQLDASLRVLQQRDAADYLTKYVPKGKNIAELVKHMTDNGLQFAPASAGGETAYTALHRALANYVGPFAVLEAPRK